MGRSRINSESLPKITQNLPEEVRDQWDLNGVLWAVENNSRIYKIGGVFRQCPTFTSPRTLPGKVSRP